MCIRDRRSGIVKGCGPSFAKAIVETFGEDTHQVLLGDPAMLTRIPKIGIATAIKICNSYRENMNIRQNVGALMEYGLTVNQAMRISAFYGDGAVGVVRENPYRLAEDVAGIGFRIADAIAMKVGIEPDSPFRIDAAPVSYTHLDVYKRQVVAYASAVLKVPSSNIELIQLPGTAMEQSPWYYLVDKEELEQLIIDVFYLPKEETSPTAMPSN